MNSSLSKWKIGLYLTAIFLAGVVAGVVLTVKVGPRLMNNPKRIEAHWGGELERRLKLSPAQAEKIKPIIHQAMGDFKTSVASQMLAGLSNCNAQIRLVLAPDQKAGFDQIEQEQLRFFHEHFGEGKKNSVTNLPSGGH